MYDIALSQLNSNFINVTIAAEYLQSGACTLLEEEVLFHLLSELHDVEFFTSVLLLNRL